MDATKSTLNLKFGSSEISTINAQQHISQLYKHFVMIGGTSVIGCFVCCFCFVLFCVGVCVCGGGGVGVCVCVCVCKNGIKISVCQTVLELGVGCMGVWEVCVCV